MRRCWIPAKLRLPRHELFLLHARGIELFGGSPGIRDEGALESALMAPENRFYYEQEDEIGCAAADAYHLTKAHAFIDGSKRVAAVATETFLKVNGVELKASDEELLDIYLGIADGSLSREQVERKLRRWASKG